MSLTDILIVAALAVALGLAARRLILNRRRGGCGCGCGGCSGGCDACPGGCGKRGKRPD